MSGSSLCNDEPHYVKALAAFYANCTEQDVVTKWWQTKMPDIIAKTSSTEPFRVLAVGTGNGKPYDEELLNMLCTSQKHVAYTVVEPSPTAVKDFKELAKKYSSVKFKWFCMTWQDFQDKEWKKEDGSQYNLVHFVHSVYFVSSSMEDLVQRLQKCYAEMVNAGGAIVTVTGNRKKKFCFVITDSSRANSEFWWDFNKILKIATDLGWNVDADELCFQFDLSKCFDEDSVEGGLLLDYLTLTKDYRSTMPREELEATMRKLEEQTDGVTKIAYPCMLDLTTIWKE